MSYTRNEQAFVDFLDTAARTLFVTAWADMCEDDETEAGADVNLSGEQLFEIAPRTDPSCYRRAREFHLAFVRVNGATVCELYEQCMVAARDADPTYTPMSAEDWTYKVTMAAMGHGVHWTDDAPANTKDPIKRPERGYAIESSGGWLEFDGSYDIDGQVKPEIGPR